MARHYGTIATAIWDDPDFRKLSGDAQRVYLMLITQPGITSVGTLAITLRRWSQYASDTPSDSLSNGLTELADRLFIVIDWDHEELLVRTFVRWDGGHTNPKRLAAIRSAAKAVGSPLLSGVLSHELTKLEVDHEVVAYPIDVHSNGYQPTGDSPRVVVTEVSTSTTHNPQQGTSLPTDNDAATPPEENREDVDQVCQLLLSRVNENGVKRVSITKDWKREARLLLDKDGYPLAEVIRILEWSQADNFWKANIQSVPKLREKFGQLLLKAPAKAKVDPYRSMRML